jgi:hypothetical protein
MANSPSVEYWLTGVLGAAFVDTGTRSVGVGGGPPVDGAPSTAGAGLTSEIALTFLRINLIVSGSDIATS